MFGATTKFKVQRGEANDVMKGDVEVVRVNVTLRAVDANDKVLPDGQTLNFVYDLGEGEAAPALGSLWDLALTESL